MTVNAVTTIVKGICGHLRWTSEITEVLRRLRRLAHSLPGAPMGQTVTVILLADLPYQQEFLRGDQTSLPRLHQRRNPGVAMRGLATAALLRPLEDLSHQEITLVCDQGV